MRAMDGDSLQKASAAKSDWKNTEIKSGKGSWRK